MRKIAGVGSGVAGLNAAYSLVEQGFEVSLFEAGATFGGHANTVNVTLEGVTHGVDTGFLVYNERTYPGLIALLKKLEVASCPSDMSFSVKAHQRNGSGLEWSGSSLTTVFTQKRRLLSGRFWNMLRDILRFNRLATHLAQSGSEAALKETVGEFLRRNRLGDGFKEDYFLPMIACIWSCPTEQMQQFPMATLIRFCHNHGLLQISRRPQWRTIQGGSRHYVNKMVARLSDARLNTPVLGVERQGGGVQLRLTSGMQAFDGVVLACHPDQSLRLLGPCASQAEQAVLASIRYQPNRAVLHTDTSVLPQLRTAWAAWNYERGPQASDQTSAVCLHYLINRLQPLPWRQSVVVSLNPISPIDPDKVLQTFHYDHPVFDAPAMAAQGQVASLQGVQRTWFCGAWCGYGFHEDGLQSGQAVAQAIGRLA
jgi:predicted NAD/FAD-binding protein